MLYYLSVQVMIGYDGKRRGFGFVSYEEPEAAEKVQTLILTVYFHCLDTCSPAVFVCCFNFCCFCMELCTLAKARATFPPFCNSSTRCAIVY